MVAADRSQVIPLRILPAGGLFDLQLNSGTHGFSKCSGPFRGDTTILVVRVKSQTGGGLPKPAVIRGKAGGAAGFFILFAAAVAASTIACGLVRQSIPAQVRSPGL